MAGFGAVCDDVVLSARRRVVAVGSGTSTAAGVALGRTGGDEAGPVHG